jgi:sec-independent protein translocase protein TatA
MTPFGIPEMLVVFITPPGIPELLIILVIILVLFGVGRVSKIAGEIGSGIRAFKEGIQGPDDEKETKKNSSEDDATNKT